MFRAVRSGGGILLTVPQHRFLWSAADEYARHIRRYSGQELRQKVITAGFQIVRMTSFVTSLLPVMWLSRLQLRAGAMYDPLKELRIGKTLNRMCEWLVKRECDLIRKGVNLPFGGSLLLVAVKP